MKKYDFVGVVREARGEGLFFVEARNKIMEGDTVEVVGILKSNNVLVADTLTAVR